jgi:hypothetical protein
MDRGLQLRTEGVSRPIRVDTRREADEPLRPFVQIFQNGSEFISFATIAADEALGIIETALLDQAEGGLIRYRLDRRGIMTERHHGPVEIRLREGSSPEAREILRRKRAGEMP